MLIKVSFTIESVVLVEDDLSLVQACREAEDYARSDSLEIFREDLCVTLEENAILTSSVVNTEADLPIGWLESLPWCDSQEEKLNCRQILEKT